jgi:hypothetical protein
MPISLSDDELAIILSAAQPLAPQDRSRFLQDVAAELGRYQEVGPGIVSRVTREAQRRYLSPPTFTGHRGIAKHGW